MKIIDRLIVLVGLLMVSISVVAGPTYRYMSGSTSRDGKQIFRTTIISDESYSESNGDLSRAGMADGLFCSETSMLNDQPGGIFKEGMESEPFGGDKRPGRQRISGRDDSLVTPEGEVVPLEDAMAPMMLLLAAFAAFKFYKK